MRLTIDHVRKLPTEQQAAWWASLTPEEADAYLHDWSFLARDEQLPPPGEWTHWLYLAGRGAGKALALDTPILAQKGWTTMGQIKTGDVLFDERGLPTTVLETHPVQLNKTCYNVVFSDGSKITADAEHLWRVRTVFSSGAREQTITTQQIKNTLLCGKERRHSVEVCAPLNYPEAELRVPPYALGVWLGDGSLGCAVLTTMDNEVIEGLKKVGIKCVLNEKSSESTGRASMYGMQYDGQKPPLNVKGCFVSQGGLHADLKEIGVLFNKHIPREYMTGSVEQRRELMKGLIDTDGSLSPTAGEYEFCSSNKKLSDDVLELALGLGLKATRSEHMGFYKSSGARKYTKKAYYIRFRSDDVLATVKRKVERALKVSVPSQFVRSKRRYIVAVEETGSVPVRCISVDSPSKLFLAGRNLIPTHNTRTGAETARQKVKEGCKRLGLIAPTASDARDVMVEGESGVLAVCWKGDVDNQGRATGVPIYEPSKRRLTWENGAIATLYSADEPERLRGPQHDFIWCFIAGTKVNVEHGLIPIEEIEPGQGVLTRNGINLVEATSSRKQPVGKVTFSNGSELVGTYDHPIYTEHGWVKLGELTKGLEVCAERNSSPALETTVVNVVSTWQPKGEQDVYCLKVKDTPEYFANSILVHNCDELCAWRRPETFDLAMFGLRLGKKPQTFISTTPKPKKIIVELKNDPSCAVTRGSTYDNRANLADNFFKTVITKYEGTRLGEQELMGVLLEEAEGALWSREILDATRVKEFNWMEDSLRIVVAVDPPITANQETSDECGIIVSALGKNGHGYVLADYSGIMTPGEWAKKAVKAYKTYNADRIVAEGNQGGLMVSHTIHTEDKNVPVKIVHASRGKAARAEPISSLFEQNRVHIVGNLSNLEDQLCTWEPLSGDQSPDRLDAMVWSINNLMISSSNVSQGKIGGMH